MTGSVPAVRLGVSLLVLLAVPIAACTTRGAPAGPPDPTGITHLATAAATPSPLPPTGVISAATAPSALREGTSAPGGRVRFVPSSIELPSGDSAEVEPVPTVNGVLQIPADVGQVGWWDGGAEAGDPFGSAVIAGHVDARDQGLGIFAQLLLIQVGAVITLRSGPDAVTYRVVSSTLIKKEALAADADAFDQRGPHRLVLITCSGRWHPELHSYDSNLVVVADPVDTPPS